MPGVIRGAHFEAEAVIVGETVRRRPAISVPPPPPPPPVPLAIELDPIAPGSSRWSSSTPWADASGGAGDHDDPFVERLGDAEQLLVDAEAQAAITLENARLEAEQLLASAQSDLEAARAEVEDARAEAERSREEARADVERIQTEARDAGREEGINTGRVDGLAKAEEEIGEKAASIAQLAESAAVDRRELLRNAEAEVVRLALQIARKVVQNELRTDPEAVARIAESALSHVTVDGQVKLRVNPEDLDVLSAYWSRSHGAAEAQRTYEIIGDVAVARGGVVIDTRAGTIDAQIETQLDEIARTMWGENASAPS